MTTKAKDGLRLGGVKRRQINPSKRPAYKAIINLKTIRLSLSGALLGVAVVGIIANGGHEAIGAFLGGTAVLIAKARHFI